MECVCKDVTAFLSHGPLNSRTTLLTQFVPKMWWFNTFLGSGEQIGKYPSEEMEALIMNLTGKLQWFLWILKCTMSEMGAVLVIYENCICPCAKVAKLYRKGYRRVEQTDNVSDNTRTWQDIVWLNQYVPRSIGKYFHLCYLLDDVRWLYGKSIVYDAFIVIFSGAVNYPHFTKSCNHSHHRPTLTIFLFLLNLLGKVSFLWYCSYWF